MNKFKVGDKIVNTGGLLNYGIRATVVAVGPFGPETGAEDCDLLVQSKHAKVQVGTDGLHKENKFYTLSSLWSLPC